MNAMNSIAPGWPGSPARWTSSVKTGVGTAISPVSRVWFTLSHGIFNEIYYPRIDRACTRDLGLIVTDGQRFFSEEKRHTQHEVSYLAENVPAYRLVNTCLSGRYRIEKEVISDPRRDVVLQRTRFVPLRGSLADYHLYVLLAPHLGNKGAGNTGWLGDYKGAPMLFAQREGSALALASSVPWLKRSVGFVDVSDGWQDLMAHKQMTWAYSRAENGNIALTAEVDLQATDGVFVLALGFDTRGFEAGHHALASLLDGFDRALTEYVRGWQEWQAGLLPLEECGPSNYRISMAMLHTHEAKSFPGGIIASLSIPWGFAKGDDDLGGYHLVWTRDLVEAAGGLLAGGAHENAHNVLLYLQVTQNADGGWPQNMWLDGTGYWGGIQMDETALPILLVDLARREQALTQDDLAQLWPMVRRAAAYLVRNGPVTQQDRWEEDPGYAPFTLAVEIAALLVAADLAEAQGEAALAAYLRETADTWNGSIERWTYVTNTELTNRFGVEGYYVRIGAVDVAEAASPTSGYVPIKNRPPEQSIQLANQIVSPDALALVRFGLRAPDDPRILNTIKVIDALLKTETPAGAIWHRYNGDGYGEHEDGSPFDGTGIGRGWPLLTGERGHYEVAAGHYQSAEKLLHTLEGLAGESGLLPEQTWDAPDIAERQLWFGRPSGSAMPLVWAHAEYVKLARSLRDGSVFDMPPQPVERYIKRKTDSPYTLWRFNNKCATMPTGKELRIEVLSPALIHWSADGWKSKHDAKTKDTGLGVYVADLPTAAFAAGVTLLFTFFWPDEGRWEGQDYRVVIED